MTEAIELKTLCSIHITSKYWMDSNGNTYFSAKTYANGELVDSVDFEGGFGEHYAYVMTERLEGLGIISPRKTRNNGGKGAPWRLFESLGVEYLATSTEVSRKRDL